MNLDTVEAVTEQFLDTLSPTNRGHSFYVHWKKIREHVERYSIELGILSVLIRSQEFERDLRRVLTRYPEVLPVLPVLIAVRATKNQLWVVSDFLDSDTDVLHYDFTERMLSDDEVGQFIRFFERTGLRLFFQTIVQNNLHDYVTGVEVGMDTHARKNRSGVAAEIVLQELITDISRRHEKRLEVLTQKPFSILRSRGFTILPNIENRKADFIIIRDGTSVINIEVNFFQGAGSKPQEIVSGYSRRQDELAENGFGFVWVTDGNGWRGMVNELRLGFQNIDYLLNLHFVREGLLEVILI
ncbi:MAG TPA: type II restriction endonuclease [Ardenticatenaceae bacterium]